MSSSHSRSSSEILAYQYTDVLPVFFRAFKENFDFDDVKDEVKDIFTKEEYQSIIRDSDEQHRLVRLFSVLCSREEAVATRFLERIKSSYSFLTEAIKRERDSPKKNTINYIDTVHMWRSSHPQHTNFNVLRMDWHIRLRNELLKLKPCHSIVLQGDLGMGKKWLTLDVCYDYDVMKAMNFQIFWLDVSDCTSSEQDLNRLQTLRLILGGTNSSHSPTFSNSSPNGTCNPVYQECARPKYNESISNRKLELQQYLRKKLSMPEYRNCLLILKDVQNLKTVQTFNLGFKLLVITRNKKVSESLSSKMTTHLPIDSGLTKDEFFALFEKYLKQTRDKFPKQAIDIYEYGNGHPYLLSIIAQNLRQRRSNWDEWIQNLKNFEISDNKFTKVVEISLNVLQPELLELYAVFGIFPHSVPIPVKLLAALWDTSVRDADDKVQRLDKFSFVDKVRCNPITQNSYNDEDDGKFCCCVLPFIYSSHLRGSKRMKSLINSKELHHKVIEYYKLEQTFSQRTEIELCDSQHDWYFFTFIGYHLQAAGERESLFPLIYLDFGFLEQKIRAVGLSNTIGDLKLYENEITNCDPRKRDLLAELREFLPKIEEKLFTSEDTSLLQYALMASGAVYEEATVQMSKFPRRVWFSERGNFHKRRQIVNLTNQAKCLHFLDQDLCLIVLANNNMLLLDISLDCITDPVILKNDEPKNSVAIIEARLFRDNNFILTLDTGGALKVWSIVDDHRRSVVYRRSSRQKVHALNFPVGHKSQSGKRYKQRIQENSMGQHGYIVAFYIEQPQNYDNETNLHIAFSNGDICLYKWNSQREEFSYEKIPILKTQANDIRFLCKLLDTYYMLINKSGDLAFWNLRDSSKSYIPFDWPKTTTGPIGYELYNLILNGIHYTRVIIVFPDKVMSLIFEKKDFNNQPNAIVQQIYANGFDTLKSTITCAKLSTDQLYLIVGTKRGLIVYDMKSESEVLRSNVSDSIASLDIYPLDDKVFKYVIICGSDHRRCLNIFAVRANGEQGIAWAHNVTSMGNEVSSDPQLEADVWLLGQKLYDVYYKDDGSTQLVAVDSKNRVHQVNTAKTKSWSIIMNRETKEPITAITTGNEFAFVGYNNGDIFNISKDVFEAAPMKAPITYLQIFDDTHIVASTAKETSIRCINSNDSAELKIKNYEFGTKKCYKIFGHYLLLINDQGILSLIDLNSADFDIKLGINGLQHPNWEKLCTCDYQNDYLILATATLITIFKFKRDTEVAVPKVVFVCTQPVDKNHTDDTTRKTISAVTLSKDAGLIAIGFTNGNIELHKMRENGIMFFYCLQSHRTRINDMKFSIGNEVLASCAEQLCFWSVPYLLNNPLAAQSPKRRSSRFSSQRSSDVEEVDARVVTPCSSNGGCSIAGGNNFLNVPQQNGGGGNHDGANGQQNDLDTAIRRLRLEETARLATAKAWCDKRGPADKPELLACIKFDGSKAEKLFANPDFTQFNTIDDEGVYYHLALLNVNEDADKNRDESMVAAGGISSAENGASKFLIRSDVVLQDFSTSSWRVSTGTDDLSIGEDEVYT